MIFAWSIFTMMIAKSCFSNPHTALYLVVRPGSSTVITSIPSPLYTYLFILGRDTYISVFQQFMFPYSTSFFLVFKLFHVWPGGALSGDSCVTGTYPPHFMNVSLCSSSSLRFSAHSENLFFWGILAPFSGECIRDKDLGTRCAHCCWVSLILGLFNAQG